VVAQYRSGGVLDIIDEVVGKSSLFGLAAHAIGDDRKKDDEKKKAEEAKKKDDAAVKSIADFAAEAQKKKEAAAPVPWWVWVGLLYLFTSRR